MPRSRSRLAAGIVLFPDSFDAQSGAVQSVHQFAEKVTLVTDGANPVGRAVALQLALQGSYVITAYPRLDPSRAAEVEELRSLGTLAGAVEADVASPQGALAVIEKVDQTFGRLDLLVNCLKFRPESSFKENAGATTEIAELNAAKFVSEAAVKLMQPRPKPKIVNVGWSENASVIELTRSQAFELPRNFRANCIAVREGGEMQDPAEFEFLRLVSSVPPDDVARIVTFLLSDESAALNGQILTVG